MRKPQKNQRFGMTAEFMGDLIDINRDHKTGRLTNQPRRSDTANVNQTSGVVRSMGGLRAGSVIGFGPDPARIVIERDKLNPLVEFMMPTAEHMADQTTGILIGPALQGGFARAQTAGRVAFARVNFSDASHTHADMVAGQVDLASGSDGYLILAATGDDGNQLGGITGLANAIVYVTISAPGPTPCPGHGWPAGSIICGTITAISGTTATVEAVPPPGAPEPESGSEAAPTTYAVTIKGGGTPPVGTEIVFMAAHDCQLVTMCCTSDPARVEIPGLFGWSRSTFLGFFEDGSLGSLQFERDNFNASFPNDSSTLIRCNIVTPLAADFTTGQDMPVIFEWEVIPSPRDFPFERVDFRDTVNNVTIENVGLTGSMAAVVPATGPWQFGVSARYTGQNPFNDIGASQNLTFTNRGTTGQ